MGLVANYTLDVLEHEVIGNYFNDICLQVNLHNKRVMEITRFVISLTIYLDFWW